ncbi:5-oxoprolinase [Burkholderia sp. Leaf177]|uniref:hydantoinase B/oxoprolinase family protein n=1 Tax=Burkholderia sp. Leaf177 TaxID=1736287 RepID=UPI000701EA09|nr:hydantoinase B/oxoprolinase family protein [Burkholderia sp. Leaf177]KQR77066.1 5-oxoprolinase [Burkholderia sp. Leaf177]
MKRKAEQASAREFDPIAMEVFSNRLMSITEEMGNTLIRSSFSSNIKERKDCSVALFDRMGRLVVQAAHIPIHLGSLSGAVASVIDKYSVGMLKEGDAFVSNDAYLAGGSHAPDITVVTPIFWSGQVEFFAANIGHHSDVGGAVPGSTGSNLKTVWEEGLRIPTTRIGINYCPDSDIIELIAHNSREPETRVHDLNAQIATNTRGEKLVHELIGASGLEAVKGSIDDIIAYTERRLRAQLRKLSGTNSFVTYMDDDGLGGDPVAIKATVTLEGDQILVDFDGSGPQARGAFNVPRNALLASVYFAIKAMIDPELLPNSGMFAPVTVTAPAGSILNPDFPASVGARATTCQKVAGSVIGALCGLLPDRNRMASSNDVMPGVVFSGPSRVQGKGTFVYLEVIGGGAGARVSADGMDGIQVHCTNSSNMPAEALEIEYPLIVEEYALVQDSGGAGKHRGGMGIARQIRAAGESLICSVRCDGALFGPAGSDAGLPGRPAHAYRNFGQQNQKDIAAKTVGMTLMPGDSIRLETPGAGGLGAPSERSISMLAADLRGGKASRERAVTDYGIELVSAADSFNEAYWKTRG